MKTREKSPEERAEENEFAHRQSRAAEVRYDNGKRYSTVSLHHRGLSVASKTSMLSRGKVTSVLYVLPKLRNDWWK